MANRFLDRDHPFFAQAWRRWAVLAVCFGWGVIEVAHGAFFWAAISIGAGIYALWELFLRPPVGGKAE